MKGNATLTITKKEKTFEEKLTLFARKFSDIKNDIKALWKQLLKLKERTERVEERLERAQPIRQPAHFSGAIELRLAHIPQRAVAARTARARAFCWGLSTVMPTRSSRSVSS